MVRHRIKFRYEGDAANRAINMVSRRWDDAQVSCTGRKERGVGGGSGCDASISAKSDPPADASHGVHNRSSIIPRLLLKFGHILVPGLFIK